MLKDTKSLGNNKASAWESRGFVIKKEGMHFDTPSCFYKNIEQFFSFLYEKIEEFYRLYFTDTCRRN